jgi:hypothetical protein
VTAHRQKDYIPDLGDCIDLVVLGAGWDIDRARELRGARRTLPWNPSLTVYSGHLSIYYVLYWRLDES